MPKLSDRWRRPEEPGAAFPALALRTEGSLSPLPELEKFLVVRLSKSFRKYGTGAALEEPSIKDKGMRWF